MGNEAIEPVVFIIESFERNPDCEEDGQLLGWDRKGKSASGPATGAGLDNQKGTHRWVTVTKASQLTVGPSRCPLLSTIPHDTLDVLLDSLDGRCFLPPP